MNLAIKATSSALLVMSMLATGCGGVDDSVNEESNVATRVDDATTCTQNGVSPQLAAVPGGPYQNCQGGTFPRIERQSGTQAWTGCCGDLLRTCEVPGYSTLNTVTCYDGISCTVGGVSPQLAAVPGGPYQNCQGGTFPRVEYQSGTQAWTGCCGDLVRTCKVSGYSTLNTVVCL